MRKLTVENIGRLHDEQEIVIRAPRNVRRDEKKYKRPSKEISVQRGWLT